MPKMDIIESLKVIERTLYDYEMSGRKWNQLNKAINQVAAELGYEFRQAGDLVCVEPEREDQDA